MNLEAQGHAVGWGLWTGAEGLELWRSPSAGRRSKGSPEDVQAEWKVSRLQRRPRRRDRCVPSMSGAPRLPKEVGRVAVQKRVKGAY